MMKHTARKSRKTYEKRIAFVVKKKYQETPRALSFACQTPMSNFLGTFET